MAFFLPTTPKVYYPHGLHKKTLLKYWSILWNSIFRLRFNSFFFWVAIISEGHCGRSVTSPMYELWVPSPVEGRVIEIITISGVQTFLRTQIVPILTIEHPIFISQPWMKSRKPKSQKLKIGNFLKTKISLYFYSVACINQHTPRMGTTWEQRACGYWQLDVEI